MLRSEQGFWLFSPPHPTLFSLELVRLKAHKFWHLDLQADFHIYE